MNTMTRTAMTLFAQTAKDELSSFYAVLESRMNDGYRYLSPHEITEIIRSADDGDVIEVWDFPDVREAYKVTRSAEHITLTDTLTGDRITIATLSGMIDDEMNTDGYITMNGRPLWEYAQ